MLCYLYFASASFFGVSNGVSDIVVLLIAFAEPPLVDKAHWPRATAPIRQTRANRRRGVSALLRDLGAPATRS